jgi:aerobic C4-dicarboxylate transport protein
MLVPAADTPEAASSANKSPFYASLSFQVLTGVALAIILGYVNPARAIAMKPLGDAFIRLITMIITLVIFCTLVTGIAGMEDMKKVGRVGGKALLYFEVVSTLALRNAILIHGQSAEFSRGINCDNR